MNRKRYVIWISLFVVVAILLVLLATGWIYKLIDLAQNLPQTKESVEDLPWYWLILGTIGFCLILAAVIVFFVKLIGEMRKNQLQSEYLARITHELKTPLATLELSSSLLKSRELDPEDVDQLWDSHSRELYRLKNNVDSLLLAARFDAKLFKPQKQPLHIESWLRSEMSHWENLLGENGEIERTGDLLEFHVQTDTEFLKLITDNILDNARKYAIEKPRVNIHTKHFFKRGRSHWTISFEDFGHGFDPAVVKQIFKPFVRAIASKKKSIPGTGLGLYLAYSAARKLGYSFHAESKGHGRGAIFTLEGGLS